ncbi:MAG TPA: hypothetical protein VKW04_23540 [Planctomycetota bacterium]|nr:hypothetical protein [Planctomycetota bacterium]
MLGLEGILALTPPFTGTSIGFSTCMGALVHVPEIALLLGFAIAVPVMTSGGLTRNASQRLLYGGFVSIGAASLARFVDVVIDSGTYMIWLFLHVGATLLFAVAAPGILGTALAWEQDLSSFRIRRVGRIFAGIAFTGGAFYGLSELEVLFRSNPFTELRTAGLGLILSSVILLAGRMFILWGAVEVWTMHADQGIVRDRVRKIQRGMIVGALATVASAFFTAYFWRLEAHGFGRWVSNRPMVIWQGFVQLTLTLMVAILLAIAMENETLSFNPRNKGPRFPDPPAPADLGPIDVP